MLYLSPVMDSSSLTSTSHCFLLLFQATLLKIPHQDKKKLTSDTKYFPEGSSLLRVQSQKHGNALEVRYAHWRFGGYKRINRLSISSPFFYFFYAHPKNHFGNFAFLHFVNCKFWHFAFVLFGVCPCLIYRLTRLQVV